MDGVHDLGGMHGFGPLPRQPDEPVFHQRWESRVFGVFLVAGAKGLLHGSPRPYAEAMAPADYLAASYYERWAVALERSLERAGTLSAAEIDARVAADAPAPEPTADPAFASFLVQALQHNDQGWVAAEGARFRIGDRVTVRRMAPLAHHRCPRYVRGATGTVVRVEGGFARPDGGPEPLYTVRFAMADLWGDDAEPGSLTLDLWEGYLA